MLGGSWLDPIETADLNFGSVGYVDKIRGPDGKEYTVSTTQKFDTWETAIFQGSALGALIGKRPCLVEVVLGDQPGEALLVHQRAAGLIALVPRAHWEMSQIEVKAQQEPAVQYAMAKNPDKELVHPPWSPTLTAIRAHNAFGPSTSPILDWLELLAELDVDYGWSEVLSSATDTRAWSDTGVFAEAARIVEGDAALRAGVTYASSAIGVITARTGAADQDAKLMMAVGRNAAVALLTSHAISDSTFRALYGPFAEELPTDETDEADTPLAATPTNSPKVTEAAAAPDSASPVPPSVEGYFEAAMLVATDFGEAALAKANLAEDKKWLAEREVAILYLGALEGWLRKLAPGKTFDDLMGDGFAYLGAPAVAEDKLDEENVFSEAADEMEAVYRKRVPDYGALVLERPLRSSEALGRAFALRLRAELGGSHGVEGLAAAAFRKLPDLHADEVARRFLEYVFGSP